MRIQEIPINSFANHYGKNVLRLQEENNYIIGQCYSVRTNLARACQFAFFGTSDFPRESRFNVLHIRECRESGISAFCEDKVDRKIKEKSQVSTAK
jgi:hypothetical protein